MRLPAIGRVEDVSELNVDPIEVPLVAYTSDREEVEEVFRFRPAQPAGATLDVLMATGADGKLPTQMIFRFLDECLVEEDRVKWRVFLDRPDLIIEQSVLAQVYRGIMEVYAARPTPRWSDSGGGGSPAGPASQAAARSKASGGSKKKT